MRENILITGGSGLLAANWANEVKDCYSVTLGMHKRHININGVKCYHIDLSSFEKVALAIREASASLVVHCAGIANVEVCEADPIAAHYSNVVIARNVALGCKLQGVKLLHISTDHLFSGIYSMVDEMAFVEPINVYAQTKAKAEVAVLECVPGAIVVRTNFFGWGLPYRMSFSDKVIQSLRSSIEIGLFCDAFFTPILMQELIKLSHALLEKGAEGLFNVVGNERLSKYEFGVCIARSLGLDQDLIKPTYLAARNDLIRRPLDLSLSNRKMKIALGSDLPELSLERQINLMLRQKPLDLMI